MSKDSTAVKRIHISKKAIDNYKKQPVFDYTIKINNDNIITKALDWIKRQIKYLLYKFFTWLLGPKHGTELVKLIVRSLPYVAIIIFAYLIFRFLIGSELIVLNKNKKYKNTQVVNLNDEQIIHEANLNELINQALQSKDYRLAVRYHYLQILKQLINQKLIDWHPDKTNRDYIKDLSNKNIQPAFINLTHIYDYVWYGKYKPDENDFRDIENQFRKFKIT